MEQPIEVADDSNVTFSFTHTPTPSTSLMFFINGMLQLQGPTSDYTLTGSVGVLLSLRVGARSMMVFTQHSCLMQTRL